MKVTWHLQYNNSLITAIHSRCVKHTRVHSPRKYISQEQYHALVKVVNPDLWLGAMPSDKWYHIPPYLGSVLKHGILWLSYWNRIEVGETWHGMDRDFVSVCDNVIIWVNKVETSSPVLQRVCFIFVFKELFYTFYSKNKRIKKPFFMH